MKKLLILTLAMCLLATASFATYTRVKTLGEANMIVPDEHNIWLFPSTINDYPELFIGEFTYKFSLSDGPSKSSGYYFPSTSGFGPGFIPNIGYVSPYQDGYTNLATHLKFGENNPFVIGVYFTESDAFTPEDFVNPSSDWWNFVDEVDDFDYGIMKNQRIDLFYGRKLGENKFGFHFGWVKSGWDDSWDEESGEDEFVGYNPKEGINMFNIGLGLGMMDNKLDLGLDFKTLSWTDEDMEGEKESESDGSMGLTLSARYFKEMNQKCTLVPHGQIKYEKLGVKYPYEEYSDKYSFTEMAIDLGVGMHYVPASGILAITDFGLIYNTEKLKYEPGAEGTEGTEDKLNSMTLPYFKAGLEATIFDWVDLRMGAVNYWMWDTWEYADYEDDEDEWIYNEEYKENYVYTEFYLGGGFHWGNLFLDAYMNPDILTDGLYFVNGNWTVPFAYQVSLKYKMF